MISIDTFDMGTDSISQCLYLLGPYFEVELSSCIIEKRKAVRLECKIREKPEGKIERSERFGTQDIEMNLDSSRKDLVSFFDRDFDRGDITERIIVSQ